MDELPYLDDVFPVSEALLFGVTSTDLPRLRVALATAPTLLSDSLRFLLSGDADVTVLLTDSVESFDVAVTTVGAPAVRAGILIELDTSPSAQGGGIARISRSGTCERLDDLDAVLRFVRTAAPTG